MLELNINLINWFLEKYFGNCVCFDSMFAQVSWFHVKNWHVIWIFKKKKIGVQNFHQFPTISRIYQMSKGILKNTGKSYLLSSTNITNIFKRMSIASLRAKKFSKCGMSYSTMLGNFAEFATFFALHVHMYERHFDVSRVVSILSPALDYSMLWNQKLHMN